MKIQNQNATLASSLKRINVIFFGLLFGMVSMGSIIYVINPTENFDFNFKNPLLIIMMVVMIAGVFASGFLYNTLKSKIETKDSLQDKIAKIQQALIIKFALIEGPALLGIILFLVESNLAFLILSVLMILYFVTLKPSKNKLADDMNLTSQERREIGE
ncbi:hypothetical protein [Chryseobacterium defluvii]|uniref:Uncharacterized protein n=1 Tax=Chryseobacterium defluvii TaxID=160396 RepID=A0A495SCF7_9FLAO|nr:hypothetical protein [Chryseobacterium defluvii]RKS96848.1 hypothetical protein BCF58_3283 [Chryseobacterium defluvii]